MIKFISNSVNCILLITTTFLVPLPTSSFSQTSIKDKVHEDGKVNIEVNDNGKNFKIEYEGEVTLTDDDKDIIAISNGGFLEIEKSSFGSKRRVVIDSDRSGNLIKKYFEGRREQEFIPDGKAWLAEILPQIVRISAIAAKTRVNRFYENGKASAVLDEIGYIDSDYVKAKYFELLLEKNLNDNELVNTINAAGREVDSDHYLSEILKSNQKIFLSSNQTVLAYLDAARSLDSDHYMTDVLRQVINDKAINDSQMSSLLELSKNVDSDHYLTEILIAIMDARTLNAQNISKVIALSDDIQSDHYKTEVLKKVINDKDLPSDAYDAFLGTLDDINSDHYISEVINELLNSKMDASKESLSKLLNIIKTSIQSDHYATTIYRKIGDQHLTEEQLIMVLESTSSIQSDHYMSEALLSFADSVRKSSESVKKVYHSAARSIDSEVFYGRAIKAIY